MAEIGTVCERTPDQRNQKRKDDYGQINKAGRDDKLEVEQGMGLVVKEKE